MLYIKLCILHISVFFWKTICFQQFSLKCSLTQFKPVTHSVYTCHDTHVTFRNVYQIPPIKWSSYVISYQSYRKFQCTFIMLHMNHAELQNKMQLCITCISWFNIHKSSIFSYSRSMSRILQMATSAFSNKKY